MLSQLQDFFEQPHAYARRLLTGSKPMPEDRSLLSNDVLNMAGFLMAAHMLEPDTLELREDAAGAIRDIAANRNLTIGKVDTGAKAADDFSALYDLLQRLHTTPNRRVEVRHLRAGEFRPCNRDLVRTARFRTAIRTLAQHVCVTHDKDRPAEDDESNCGSDKAMAPKVLTL